MSLREKDVFGPPPKRRRKPERAAQKVCVAWLRARGALVAVTDAGAAYRAGSFFGDAVPAGWPDITGVLLGGRFIGVECKATGGRQSPAQKDMQNEITRRGGIYVLARGVEDLAEAVRDAEHRG